MFRLLSILAVCWLFVFLCFSIEVAAFWDSKLSYPHNLLHYRGHGHRRTTALRATPLLEVVDQDKAQKIAKTWIRSFASAVRNPSVDDHEESILDHFVEQEVPFWRDMVAMTWNIVTLEGREAIYDFCRDHKAKTLESLRHWELDVDKDVTVTADGTRIEFWSVLGTAAGTGRAHTRLQNEGSDDINGNHHPAWKAVTLLTVLSALHDRPWQVAPQNRAHGVQHGPIPGRQYFHDTKKDEKDVDSTFVLIVGGGQGGLSLGARLKLLDIPYLIVESGAAPGASWRSRYPSLCLHDPVYYNHMPYLPFPKTWPTFCPRDKIADWMEFYAKALDLNVQTNSKVVSLKKKENGSCWEADIRHRDPSTQVQSKRTMSAKHVVFATGNSSHPRIPKIPGQFGGVTLHSSQYKGGQALKSSNKYNLQHAVVIGSNNSAFDIVQDLWEQLSSLQSITMIQRTPSMVVSTDAVLKYGLGPLYAEDAAHHHEEADLIATTVPYKLALRQNWKRVTQLMQDHDAELLRGVEKAGYCLESGPDGTGIFAKSATEGGGFYINVGAAELLMRGDVRVKYATVERLEEDAVVIKQKDDGQEERLPADLIVYATGYSTMDQYVHDLCGGDVARAVGKTWGLGLGHKSKDPGPWEGELRNMWKPTAVEGLWFQGGNLAQNRHYSRYLALQLAARYMGMETHVYGIPQPTPLAASL